MNIRARVVTASTAAAAIIAALVVMLPTAEAATTPPYEPDTYSLGSLTLYDASGNEVTSGSTTTGPIVKYAVASGTTTDTGATQFAHLSLATPDGTVNTYNYASEALGSDTNYPVSGAGVPSVVSSAGSTTPVATGGSGDLSVATVEADFPNSQTGAYAGLYQLRLYTPSTAAMTPSAKYFSVDILVDDTAHTWQVVYPTPSVTKKTTTWTAITPNPVSPAAHGASVTLSATLSASDSSNPDGTVTWKDGATTLAGGTFTAGTGVASITMSPADGSHSYSVAFAPTDSANYNGTTSASLSYSVNAGPGSDATSTAITSPAADGVVDASSAVALTAHVTDTINGATIPTGSVTFSEGSTTLGSGSVDGSGNATATLAVGALSIGDHSISAAFAPTGSFLASSTAAATAVHAYTSAVQNTVAPSAGSARVGGAVACGPGSWYNAATYSYAWYLDAAVTPFATTSKTGLVPATWRGHKLRCSVTARSTTGSSATATSAQVTIGLGGAVRATKAPTVTGTVRVGSRVRAGVGTWSATPVRPTSAGYRYVWGVGRVVVSRNSYWIPAKAYRGKYVVLTVYALRGGFLTGAAHSGRYRIR